MLMILARALQTVLAPSSSCVDLLVPDRSLARRALGKHASQRVWYRSLFITFASCAYVNTLRRAGDG